jgi:VWFA-related protein
MPRSLQTRFPQRAVFLSVVFALSLFPGPLCAQTPPAPADAAKPAASAPPQTPAEPNNAAEVSTQETSPTFRVRVNLVQVRVVVRDDQGKIVPNLKKEDFQLFDNRKPQAISTFSVETPETPAAAPADKAAPGENSNEAAAPASVTAIPQRFVSVVFDDTDMSMNDTLVVRAAATRLFHSLAASDRIGVYTTSGQFGQEFTADRELLEKSLLHIVPRPLATGPGIHSCPDIIYYQADRIVNFHDDVALNAAVEDAIQCAFSGNQNPPQLQGATLLAQSEAKRVLAGGDSQTDFIYRHLEDVIKRLSGMPGQRVMVFISPGFVVTYNTQNGGDLIDRANRANIVINTIDARGLYTSDFMGDISQPPLGTVFNGQVAVFRTQAQFAQGAILGDLAAGTGGTYFHNRNDLDEGLVRAAAAPQIAYIIGFSPQNLKIDGRYHTLKVSLVNDKKFIVQARHGYYAPRTIADPAEAANQEIEEAIFSQQETFDLPVELHTQFFKPDQTKAQLTVLTHVDVKGLHFRKAEGRSRDDLTFATAIFDENGNFVTGGEKVLKMRLLDPTLDRVNRSGFTVKSNFDLKPGTYLVRLVVRDGENAQMAARNGAVTIPN